MIAGFDPSITHLGWVIFDENLSGKEAVLEAGVFQTSTADGLLVQRILMQKERVRKLLISKGIKFISMEAPYWGDFSTELLFALNQHIHEVFLDLNVFVIYLQPKTIKKYVYPDMDANDVQKNHMTHAAKTELGLLGKRFSEHAADAYYAGKIGLKFYQWYFMHKYSDSDLTEKERDMFCGKHTFVKGAKKGLTEYYGLIYRENNQFFDYSKHLRKSHLIAKEVNDGEDIDSGRIFEKNS